MTTSPSSSLLTELERLHWTGLKIMNERDVLIQLFKVDLGCQVRAYNIFLIVLLNPPRLPRTPVAIVGNLVSDVLWN